LESQYLEKQQQIAEALLTKKKLENILLTNELTELKEQMLLRNNTTVFSAGDFLFENKGTIVLLLMSVFGLSSHFGPMITTFCTNKFLSICGYPLPTGLSLNGLDKDGNFIQLSVENGTHLATLIFGTSIIDLAKLMGIEQSYLSNIAKMEKDNEVNKLSHATLTDQLRTSEQQINALTSQIAVNNGLIAKNKADFSILQSENEMLKYFVPKPLVSDAIACATSTTEIPLAYTRESLLAGLFKSCAEGAASL